MKLYTEDQVRDLLRSKITYDYSQADMAREAGVTNGSASLALGGQQGVGIRLPKLVGMKRVIAYVRDDA